MRWGWEPEVTWLHKHSWDRGQLHKGEAGRDESELGQRKTPGAEGEERGQSRGNMSITSWAAALQGGHQKQPRVDLPLACPFPSSPAWGDPNFSCLGPIGGPDDSKTPRIIFFLTLQYCIGFAIYQHESATGIHVFHILSPPPSSLPVPCLWVVPVHQCPLQ